MSSGENHKQSRFLYSSLVVLLAGLSGGAVFFTLMDEDIQVNPKESRPTSSRSYLHLISSNLQERIYQNLSPSICREFNEFFVDTPIFGKSHLKAIDSKFAAEKKLLHAELEALNRCEESKHDVFLQRACFAINTNKNVRRDSFLKSKRAMIEIQLQVRSFEQRGPVNCKEIFVEPNHHLSLVAYYTVYWVKDDGKGEYIQRYNDGFRMDVPQHRIESAALEPASAIKNINHAEKPY